MKLNKTTALVARKGFTLVELLVVIAIIAALAGLSYGPIMKQLNAADRTEAISNARSINTAMLSFYAANNGNYPNNNTGRGTNVTSPETAFQQLISSKFVDDKKFFWHRTAARKGVASINEPANNNVALTTDEVVWSYMMNLDASQGSLPLFFDSVVSLTSNTGSFLPSLWTGKAIVARVDGSVTAEQINFAGTDSDTAGPAAILETTTAATSSASGTGADIFAPNVAGIAMPFAATPATNGGSSGTGN